MSFIFSRTSKERLNECHFLLQEIANEAIKRTKIDFKILCGHRNKKDQDKAFQNGYSYLKFPDSKHNKIPSQAFDFCPLPVDFTKTNVYMKIINVMKVIASEKNINLRFGYQWGDYGHVELEGVQDVNKEIKAIVEEIVVDLRKGLDKLRKVVGE